MDYIEYYPYWLTVGNYKEIQDSFDCANRQLVVIKKEPRAKTVKIIKPKKIRVKKPEKIIKPIPYYRSRTRTFSVTEMVNKMNVDNTKYKYCIYSLRSSDSEIIEYIGVTRIGMKQRLISHITESFRINSIKCRWMSDLITSGKTPVIEAVDTEIETEDELYEKERFYIKLYMSMGANLKNSTYGGLKGQRRIPREFAGR